MAQQKIRKTERQSRVGKVKTTGTLTDHHADVIALVEVHSVVLDRHLVVLTVPSSNIPTLLHPFSLLV